MPKFAANLTMLFNEAPFLDRFERAAAAGFQAVEFLFPYDHPAEEIKAKLDAHRLQLVLHNLPAGDWAAGERGIACHPERVAEFRDGVARAVSYAKVLGVSQLNCLAGKAPAGVADETLRRTLVDNLRYAAGELKKANLKLLIEPINTSTSRASTSTAPHRRWRSWTRWARTTPTCNTTSTTRSAWKANSPRRWKNTSPASRTSSSPTTRAATNPARAKSTTPSCSTTSTASATPVSSAANTNPRPPPRPGWGGGNGSRFEPLGKT
jgi:hypothetical protein